MATDSNVQTSNLVSLQEMDSASVSDNKQDTAQTVNKEDTATNVLAVDPYALEWPCYFVWALVVLLDILIVLYHRRLLEGECKDLKFAMVVLSTSISFMTVIESIFLFTAWMLGCTYRFYHPSRIAYGIVFVQCLMATLHLVMATICLAQRTCFQDSSAIRQRSDSLSGLERFALRFDVKIVGILHLVSSCLLFASAMYIGRHRSDEKIRRLKELGLFEEWVCTQYTD